MKIISCKRLSEEVVTDAVRQVSQLSQYQLQSSAPPTFHMNMSFHRQRGLTVTRGLREKN